MTRPRIAIFGVSPASLLLGRACCLADTAPVGLYDADDLSALKGALFLGICARKDPQQLNPDSNPLQVAIIGNADSAEGLARIDRKESLLIISLFPGAPTEALTDGGSFCLALPSQTELSTSEIASTVPEISFQLEGDERARHRARQFLSGLSPNIACR